jgi:myo-inositol 2-dehydrogenase/D-chiro-inositol 1-dehydrogenase
VNSVRVGIIGTKWGRMHIGGFRAAGAEGVEIRALCGSDPEKTARIAREEGIRLATTRVDELCAAVDVVVVSGPDRLHHEHITAALDAGCHVLSEKPLTRTAEDALALASRAGELAASGRRCAVSFPYRMSPPLVALQGWLEQREPGVWLTVTLRSSFAAAEGRAAEGPIMGASGDFGGASHVLDAAFWLMRGRPLWAQAIMDGRPAHSLAMHIGLDTGGVVSVNHVAAYDPGIIGVWHLIGSGWEARFTGTYRPQDHGWTIGPSEAWAGAGWHEIGARVQPGQQGEPWAHAHRDMAAAFLAAVAGEQSGPVARLAGFDRGADVQAAFDAAMTSERTHRRVEVRRG